MITYRDLQEGVYDPNIFKAFFLAGGPGSGKSYVVRRTTGGLGMRIVNSDEAFEKRLKDAGYSLDTRKMDEIERDRIRGVAKKTTKRLQQNYIDGRLGLIIDGTGKDYDKITNQARQLEALGYDTHMIFVNTSLDVALQRNAERPRKLAEPLVVQSWNDVQKYIGKCNNYFQGNFIIVDNNDAKEEVFTAVFKRISSIFQSLLKRFIGVHYSHSKTTSGSSYNVGLTTAWPACKEECFKYIGVVDSLL